MLTSTAPEKSKHTAVVTAMLTTAGALWMRHRQRKSKKAPSPHVCNTGQSQAWPQGMVRSFCPLRHTEVAPVCKWCLHTIRVTHCHVLSAESFRLLFCLHAGAAGSKSKNVPKSLQLLTPPTPERIQAPAEGVARRAEAPAEGSSLGCRVRQQPHLRSFCV